MSQFQVQQIISIDPFQSNFGPMYAVKMAGLLDGQVTPSASINVKDANKAPQPGSVLDVSIQSQDSYGVKLKKNPPAPPVNQMQVPPVPMPVGGGNYPTQPPQVLSPAPDANAVRQNSIERQSCLAQAVSYCTSKAELYSAAKKHDEAISYLEGKKVLQVATYFNSYIRGKVTVPMTPEEIAHEFGYERTATEVLNDPLPEVEVSDEWMNENMNN